MRMRGFVSLLVIGAVMQVLGLAADGVAAEAGAVPTGCNVFPGSTVIGTPGNQIATLARQISTNVSETTYSFPLLDDPYFGVRYDSVKGSWTSNTDCSGFASYVLHCVSPRRYTIVSALKEADQPVPRAHVYYRFFSNLPTGAARKGWMQVTDLRKAKTGDILAWCLNDWCTTQGSGETGHVMVIDSVVTVEANLVSVNVIDSSGVIHHGNPPYKCGSSPCAATGRNGVGLGAIHFQIDPQTGAPTGFQFNTSGGWMPDGTGVKSVGFAIGRVTAN